MDALTYDTLHDQQYCYIFNFPHVLFATCDKKARSNVGFTSCYSNDPAKVEFTSESSALQRHPALKRGPV
jgi:hypothetical protein